VFQALSEQLGQQFIVENRAGAGGTIGSAVVANSPPDGYTIMVQSATHVANPHLYKNLPYDTLRDFVGVTTLARQVGMLVVHPSMPAKTVKDFVSLAKANPDKISYGSSGSASFTHLAMALFGAKTGTRLIHVPYKGGGPSAIALISGETQAMIHTIGAIYPHVESGRVRAIAVTSEKREKQLPNIPTISETTPGFEFTSWLAAFVPAKTPRPVVDKLNVELKRVLETPDVSKKLSDVTLDPWYMTPEQFAQHLRREYKKYEEVVRVSGARVD
jgi:tripartite-type tricarboxylate transporter receptor subunit TctC